MNFWNSGLRSILLVALFLTVPISCAKQANHDHSQHSHSHPGATTQHHHDASSDHSPAVTAQNYADAVKQMQARMASLDAILKSGKYDDVHKDTEAIRKLCGSLGELAAAQNSLVPKDKVKEVTDMAAELSKASRSFHSAAHDEDLPQVKEHYAHMGKLIESLSAYARASGS
jgi:hypothetical protein